MARSDPPRSAPSWATGTAATRSPAAVAAEGRRLGEELLRRFGSDNAVWWVHNHHLGRNPAFTQALLEVARSGRQRLILQIHDFPECGRYDNLARLRRSLAAPPYPIGPSVRYALINRRDLAVLREAGIPAEHLHLLENPLEPDDGRAAAPAAEVRRALGLAAPAPAAVPGALHPAQERPGSGPALPPAALEPAGLAVTLPGISAEERGYSRGVQRAFARGWAPGAVRRRGAPAGAGPAPGGPVPRQRPGPFGQRAGGLRLPVPAEPGLGPAAAGPRPGRAGGDAGPVRGPVRSSCIARCGRRCPRGPGGGCWRLTGGSSTGWPGAACCRRKPPGTWRGGWSRLAGRARWSSLSCRRPGSLSCCGPRAGRPGWPPGCGS